MRQSFFLFKVLLLNLFFVSCNNTGDDCSLKKFNFSNRKYQAQGCMINGLEHGEWSFFNADNQLSEKGMYENGFRVGQWYYRENKNDSIIAWKKYEKKNLQLAFNIPVLLEIVEDSSDYIKFSNNDTSKLFNVVLSIHSIEETNKKIDQYYKQGEEEITANGWSFTSQRSKIITPSRELYFNKYAINQTSAKKFQVLNAYTLLNNTMIFEITCRYSGEVETSAKLIFFSILTNSFF